MASSIGAPYEITVPDDAKAIFYSACDNGNKPVEDWVWEGKEWTQVDDAKEAVKALIEKYSAKPEPKPEPKPVTVDPKVYKVAEEYTAEFDKRQKAVEKAAKKVLK